MTNGNNAIQLKHLDSISADIKRYVLEELNGVNIGALDTVPATINGGVWIEQKNGVPELRFYYDDYVYYFSSTALDNPNLTLSTSSIRVTPLSAQTVTLSYSGSGEISINDPNPSALTASYDSSTKTITLTNNQADSDDDVNVNLTINLSEAGSYSHDFATLTVACAHASPELTLSSTTAIAARGSDPFTVTLSYLGSGTVSITNPNPSALIATYNSNTKTITLTNNQADSDDDVDVNLTVNLSKAGAYAAESVTLTVSCVAPQDPQLTLSSTTAIAYRGSDPTTVTLSYLGSGTVSITNPNPSALTASYDSSTKTITLTNNQAEGADAVDVNLIVNLSKAGVYAAESVTLTVSCVAPLEDPQLTLKELWNNPTWRKTGDSTYRVDIKDQAPYYAVVQLSYLGTGEISIIGNSDSYNSSAKQFGINTLGEDRIITVNLSASPGYFAVSVTIDVNYVSSGTPEPT